MGSSPLRLLLVGCGRMGGALLAGWKPLTEQAGGVLHITVVDPVMPKGETLPAVSHVARLEDLSPTYVPNILFLAVKPQTMENVLKTIKSRKGWDDVMMLSIAAGKSLEYYQKHLGKDALMVRVMSNTPALVGRAVSALVASGEINEVGRQWATRLMGVVGEVIWFEDETAMDAFTAVAGSGPAYLFYLMETMASAARAAGLSDEVARKAAYKTVEGAVALYAAANHASSVQEPEQLRVQVTSPGGTTEAAMAVLAHPKKGLKPLMHEAVEAAVKRARQL